MSSIILSSMLFFLMVPKQSQALTQPHLTCADQRRTNTTLHALICLYLELLPVTGNTFALFSFKFPRASTQKTNKYIDAE